jgi:hypothetical protein
VKQKLGMAGLAFLCCMVMSGRARAEDCRTTPGLCVNPNNDVTRQNVSLRIYRDYLVVVEGQFGDRGEHQNFILDTGTAPSIINSRLIKKLGLTPIASTMTVIGKMVPTQTAILPELNLGPLHASSVHVQLQDLTAVERNFGVSLAGILGMDVLGQVDFRLDYEKKLLIFGDVPAEGIPVSFDSQHAIAVASVKIDGSERRMLVDTGTDQVALLGAGSKHGGGPVLHSTSQEGSNVANSSVQVEAFFSPDIVLGGQHFTVKKGYFVPGNSEPNFDGLLGVRALGFRALAYNREREAVYLQK